MKLRENPMYVVERDMWVDTLKEVFHEHYGLVEELCTDRTTWPLTPHCKLEAQVAAYCLNDVVTTGHLYKETCKKFVGVNKMSDSKIQAIFGTNSVPCRITDASDLNYELSKWIGDNFILGLGIKKVIFNDPATIVFWNDGTKTIVKTQNGEDFDREKGFAMAVAKKALGNTSKYYDEFKKWCVEEDKEETSDESFIDQVVDSIGNIFKTNKEDKKNEQN